MNAEATKMSRQLKYRGNYFSRRQLNVEATNLIAPDFRPEEQIIKSPQGLQPFSLDGM